MYKLLNKFCLLWLFFLLLISSSSWAKNSKNTNLDNFPKPYFFEDKSLGSLEPRFTLNQNGFLPGWLSLSLQNRTRYETLNHSFRSGGTGSDQVLSLRTLIQATLHLNSIFKIQLEFQDSRSELADFGTPISTSIVNSVELLEANIQLYLKDLFQSGSHSILRGGRLTLGVGKRRLVARNRFRNTKNAFTGIDGIWQSKNENQIRLFLTSPVNRKPTSSFRLLNNDVSFDSESFDRILWGVFIASSKLPWNHKGEIYLIGYHEEDSQKEATLNRKLYSPGFRIYRPNQKGQMDYEWESIFQFGSSRATTSLADIQDLNHFAQFHHFEIGYSFHCIWSPRLIAAYDFASGDNNPNDGKNGRFDTLFGASVFDFGPTSIYQAFNRSNIHGPGIKLILKPIPQMVAYLHYRVFWLASDTDLWSGNSDLQDSTGNSDSFLGHQIFTRGTWQIMGNVQLEGGLVYRIDGDFQNEAPNAPRLGNTLYSYVSVTLSF